MKKISSYTMSFICCASVAFILIIIFGESAIGIPLAIGILTSSILLKDTVDWARSRLDSFDPGAILGLAGLMYFLISPVSQVSWDFWPYLPALTNDSSWISFWSVLNLFGALTYKFFSRVKFKRSATTYVTPATFNHKRFIFLSLMLLALCAVCQLYIYASFGGILGFIATFTARQAAGIEDEDPFAGMGMLMLVAESFKFLFSMFVIYWIKDWKWAKSNYCFAIIMTGLLITFILFGGLRGSRSSTLFSLIFAAGMYHFWIRKLPVRMLLAGVAFSLLFATSYYWYKIAGADGLSAIVDSSARQSFHSSRQNVDQYLVVRDLGRMDMQTLALKKIVSGEQPLSFGRTYLVSIFSSIPKSILPFIPDQVTKEKTELIHGRGSYQRGEARQTTLVLGQFGESLINFGIPGIFLFYAALGLFVGKIRSLIKHLPKCDIRLLFIPVTCLIPLLMIGTDMNVLLMQLVRYLTIPLILTALCLKITKKNTSLSPMNLTTPLSGAA
jgi:hypothetical protein